nr:glycoside hydrolase family 2 TIM barrel-domain containing protein [uncultured Pedobacter sp.]
MKIFKPIGFFICCLFISVNTFAQNIEPSITLTKDWKFQYGGTDFAETPNFNDTLWSTVNIPHTWNAKDIFDDDLTYARGIAWYRKSIALSAQQLTNNVSIYFDGVYQIADIYINGAFVGEHKGGYTAFSFDITDKLQEGKNTIAVKVNSAQNPFIPPLSIGYASYGGIYRPVKLVFSKAIRFNGVYAGSGIKIKTPQVSNEKASIEIDANIKNTTDINQNIKLTHNIYNDKKQLVRSLTKNFSLAANQSTTINLNSELQKPQLWSPDIPNLYQVESALTVNGKTIATVKTPLGFRWFSFSPSTGFSLNGAKYILKGTNRHQDMEGKGDALSNEDHLRDMQMIKDMGANFIRLAHYPQSPRVLALADSLGLLIWEEIPVVNYMNPVPEFLANAKNMIKEMINQGYNHPSVIIWGSMNEILLWGKNAERVQEHENEKEYVKKVQKYGVALDSLVRATDPSRYSVIAMHQSKEYDKFNISKTAQISAYNIYSGWYSGKVNELTNYLDKRHQENPDQILLVSEYGAGSDGRLNTSQPKRLDFSGQYQRFYHEEYLRQFKQLPYLSGTAVWNEFDFSQPNIGGTIININQKGLVNFNRTPKDVYYLYQANWASKPMIHIASHDWTERAGDKNRKIPLEIYSNLKNVSLNINGKKQGRKPLNDVQKAVYNSSLKYGKNFIEATAYNGKNLIKDTLTINLRPKAIDRNTFKSLTVNIGANTQYLDREGNIWVEDQPYQKGQFGYIGGTPVTMNLKKLIKGTNDVPLYYSSLEGLKAYKIDVPNGNYEVTLGFVEQKVSEDIDRIFSVSTNGKELINNINLNKQVGEFKSYQKTFRISTSSNQGINLTFSASQGTPILSALAIKKTQSATN